MKEKYGSFVVSLDFELFWGVQDNKSVEKYYDNLYGVHSAVPRILEEFRKYKIHATWATVGFLFFNSKDELIAFLPDKIPGYINTKLSPYRHLSSIKSDNKDNSIYFAQDLVKEVSKSTNQEIGSHTFSHYCCNEDGQNIEEFASDLQAFNNSSKDINLNVSSLVFPRNQVNVDYLATCSEFGITSYRGNQDTWLYKDDNSNDSLFKRLFRLTDSYVNLSGYNTYILSKTFDSMPLNIPASQFLRPYSNYLKYFDYFKLRRIKKSMTYAAKTGRIYHLWWHPHNFGINLKDNISFLIKILEHYLFLKNKYGMQSLNMNEIYCRYTSVSNKE